MATKKKKAEPLLAGHYGPAAERAKLAKLGEKRKAQLAAAKARKAAKKK